VIEKESGDPGAPGPHSKLLDCGDLRLVFDWLGDRYGQRIEQQTFSKWSTILESLEGSADEIWPPSPPLQSVHIEHRETGPVALLVGKSGTSHWSASIEPVALPIAFQFDIACRVQCPPGRLGSIYQVAGGSDRSIVKVAAPQQQATCDLIEQNKGINSWHIRPVIDSSCEFPCTIRWRYTISVDNHTA
jgi:hypothetical protein